MRQSVFPVSGESRVPLPHICIRSPGDIVGLRRHTVSIPGASNPVVRHSTFATYLSGGLPFPKIVGIDYINLCFSLLLFGLSLLLTILGRKAINGNTEVIIFYGFLTVVGIFRGCLGTFNEPWP